MKEVIEILIRQDGLRISAPFKKEAEFIAASETSSGNQLISFCAPKNPAGMNIIIYIAEDLLFFKKISLPLNTTDLKEAIGYQLTMLAPFAGKSLSGYTVVRDKQRYSICLYAAAEEVAEPLLKEAASHGFKLAGLFPESQRYVTRHSRKHKEWALLLPGRIPKLLFFSAGKITNRLLCHTEPSSDELDALKAADVVYRSGWTEGSHFLDADVLLMEKPILKEFNLLPPSFKRPDYLRYVLIGLCLLNLAALTAVGAIREYNVLMMLKKVDVEIEKLRPEVKEVELLRMEEKKLVGIAGQIENAGRNLDIIALLEKITRVLPANSYLDQLRMDDKTGDIQLQGYTDDIGVLTSKLDELGHAKLKATSRRKNLTYFNVEISGP